MNAKAISENKQASGCGRIGGCLFGMVFAAFGAGFLWFMVVSPILKTRAAKTWTETQCRILSSEVEEHTDEDGTSYKPRIKFEFEHDGLRHEGDDYSFSIMSGESQWARQIVKQYRPGEQHTCYFDPNDPNDSVLNREMDWSASGFFLPVFIPSIFLLIGLGISAFALFGPSLSAKTGTSVSGRSDASRSTPSGFRHHTSNQPNRPTLETSGYHTEDQLDKAWSVPQKLQPESSTWVTFLILLGIAFFWNGIVSVFLFAIFTDDMTIWGRIGFGLFLTPFVLVGLVLLSSAIYMFMALFNPGVEVAMSTGAVALGDEVDIAWEIDGSARRIRKLKVEIQGEQSATYRRGTTTSTDTEVFELIPVAEVTQQSEIEFGSARIRIPESTMHTFDSGNNKINWSVVVQGEIAWWPDVNANYPFRVKPAPNQS